MVTSILAWGLKNWKVLTFAGAALAVVGLGWGAWWFLDRQVDARYAAEAKAAQLEQEVESYKRSAAENAEELARLNQRLDAEGELAKKRLATEQERALAAEARARNAQGSLNDLRNRLSEAAGACNCGIGSDLTERLRQSRDERQAALGPD